MTASRQTNGKTTVDLITGFLGAGKTTFIMLYAKWLEAQGVSIAVIENEFGTAGCDGAMLKDIGLAVSELSGGCICCSLKVDFAHALVELSGKVDRIIVEPSGIFSPADFFEVMNSPSVREVCEVGCVVAVADPFGFGEMSTDAAAVLAAQIESAGVVLVSKTDTGSDFLIDGTVAHIQALLGENAAENRILTKSWNTLTDKDYTLITESRSGHLKRSSISVDHAAMFNSGTVLLKRTYTVTDLRRKLETVLADDACGEILRIKGNVLSADGGLLWVNCTASGITIEPIREGIIGLNIIGKRIVRKRIRTILEELIL